MAHFAKVENGIVTKVIVAEPEYFETFVDSSPGEWFQTSINTHGGVHYNPETGEPSADQSKALRKNYAGVGFTYDKTADAFYPPKPWASWILDPETGYWNPPTTCPQMTDTHYYVWDEPTTSWVARQIG